MNYFSGKCPVCSNNMRIAKWECGQCGTMMEGEFEPNLFSKLDSSEMEFVHVFLRCRGSIKEVESMLNISYPTVRKNLDEILSKLYGIRERYGSVREVMEALSKGKITSEEAGKLLEEME